MALKLVVSDTVTVPVDGNLTDEDGKKVPFNFRLKCKRLSTSALRAELEAVTSGSMTGEAFMSGVSTGWTGVLDADGKEVEFSTGALEQLWEIPGVAMVAFAAYVAANGAEGKAKN